MVGRHLKVCFGSHASILAPLGPWEGTSPRVLAPKRAPSMCFGSKWSTLEPVWLPS